MWLKIETVLLQVRGTKISPSRVLTHSFKQVRSFSISVVRQNRSWERDNYNSEDSSSFQGNNNDAEYSLEGCSAKKWWLIFDKPMQNSQKVATEFMLFLSEGRYS